MNDALTTIAAEILSVARAIPAGHVGRYDGERVYIGAVWAMYCERHGNTSREHFMRWVSEAHTMGLLSLNRADLVGAMAAGLLRLSTITKGLATFHFIVA